jgi:hypothetical protein
MRRGVVYGLLAAVLLATTASANQYDGRMLKLSELKLEAEQNSSLDEYLTRNGLPDVAEARMLFDQMPWDTHEITLYYLGTRKEISFTRALVLGVPNVHLPRYERSLTDADVAVLMQVMEVAALGPEIEEGALEGAASDIDPIEPVAYVESETIETYDESLLEDVDPDDPVARAEAAAIRADVAATRIEAAADGAETAALRAEKAFDRLAASIPNAAR